MKKILNLIINSGLEFIAGAMIVSIFFIVSLGVLDRFILHFGLAWTTELTSHLLIWICFLSAVVVIKKNAHFCVEYFFRKFLPPTLQGYWMFTIKCICLFSLLILDVQSIKLVLNTQNVSPALQLNMKIVYSVVPISFFLMTIILFKEMFSKGMKGNIKNC